ncbi:MAG: hypothetical protein OWQ52_02950 [Metallosphaera prunae]|uniref:hypothetical protein n=1 Tax=Metallosphaera prunae TaxID=47304 RepID=UPI0022748C89|nr:hypothetical protein [Metallosphaera prunae]MCY0861365.1 hypothetical protein [Metallosphaera prunae]
MNECRGLEQSELAKLKCGHEDLLSAYIDQFLGPGSGQGEKLDGIGKYLTVYLHDIFKGVAPSGRKSNDEKVDQMVDKLKKIFQKYDVIASIAEESEQFIEDNKKIKDNFDEIKSAILNPFNLAPQRYLYVAEGTPCFVEAQPQPRFDCIVKDVELYLKSKYGEGFNHFLEVIQSLGPSCSQNPQGQALNLSNLKVLVDSARFFSQRSWISANDISLLGHLRGALLASLEKIVVYEIKNPFYTQLKTLKDLEGIYNITRIFLFNLNKILLQKLENGMDHPINLPLYLPNVPENSPNHSMLFQSPLIDFFTPFIYSADRERFNVFMKDEGEATTEKLKYAIEEAMKVTLKEIFEWAKEKIGVSDPQIISSEKIEITNTRAIDLCQPMDNAPDEEKLCKRDGLDLETLGKLAPKLNSLLEVEKSTGATKVEQIKVELGEGNQTKGTCVVCKRRPGLKLDVGSDEKMRKVLGLNDEDVICHMCAAVRLSTLMIGRASSRRKGESIKTLEDGLGWNELLEPDVNGQPIRGRSIDELSMNGEDTIVYIALKLSLKSFRNQLQREVKMIDYLDILYKDLGIGFKHTVEACIGNLNSKEEFLGCMRERIFEETNIFRDLKVKLIDFMKLLYDELSTKNKFTDAEKTLLSSFTSVKEDHLNSFELFMKIQKFIKIQDQKNKDSIFLEMIDRIMDLFYETLTLDRNPSNELIKVYNTLKKKIKAYIKDNNSNQKIQDTLSTSKSEGLNGMLKLEEIYDEIISFKEKMLKLEEILNVIESKEFESIRFLLTHFPHVTIPASLDREFSLRLNFSMLAEEMLALMYLKDIQQLILVFPSAFTTLMITAIRKSDLPKFIEEVLPKFSWLNEGLSPLPSSLILYMIRAKTYTPISLIMNILDEEISPVGFTLAVVPVIVERNNVPNEPLNAFSLDEVLDLKPEEWIQLENREEFAEFFVSSSMDVAFPEFRNHSKFENDTIHRYVETYSGEPFSVRYDQSKEDRRNVLRAYLVRLIK